MAAAAASRDPRFPPIDTADLRRMTVEISVLSPDLRIHRAEEIEIGRHGLDVRRGGARGLLLPQVASSTASTAKSSSPRPVAKRACPPTPGTTPTPRSACSRRRSSATTPTTATRRPGAITDARAPAKRQRRAKRLPLSYEVCANARVRDRKRGGTTRGRTPGIPATRESLIENGYVSARNFVDPCGTSIVYSCSAEGLEGDSQSEIRLNTADDITNEPSLRSPNSAKSRSHWMAGGDPHRRNEQVSFAAQPPHLSSRNSAKSRWHAGGPDSSISQCPSRGVGVVMARVANQTSSGPASGISGDPRTTPAGPGHAEGGLASVAIAPLGEDLPGRAASPGSFESTQFQVIHFSVQTDHIHLVVEADAQNNSHEAFRDSLGAARARSIARPHVGRCGATATTRALCGRRGGARGHRLRPSELSEAPSRAGGGRSAQLRALVRRLGARDRPDERTISCEVPAHVARFSRVAARRWIHSSDEAPLAPPRQTVPNQVAR